MKTIGITGSIGSGKTSVAKVFEAMGYPVFYADLEAKKQYQKKEVIEKIINWLGFQILTKQGEINLAELAKIVFSDLEKLEVLNSIIHPLVINDFLKWKLDKNTASLLFMESAIIFEHHLEYLFDEIICVWTPLEECINRSMLRDGLSRSEVEKRISMQMLADEKKKKSNFIINNENSSAILPQIIFLLSKLAEK